MSHYKDELVTAEARPGFPLNPANQINPVIFLLISENYYYFSVLDSLATDGSDVPGDQEIQGGDEHRQLCAGN